MKKKTLITLAVLLAVLATALFCHQKWYDSTHVEIEGANILCDVSELTLSGSELPSMESLHRLTQLKTLDIRSVPVTLEQYDQLRQEFPQLEIFWLVPFQGSYLSQDTKVITVETLSSEDLNALVHLSKLETIHAEGCRDYAILTELMAQRPDLEITYTVTVGGHEYPNDTTSLTVQDADVSELSDALSYLLQIEKVTFTGAVPDNETIYQMKCQYPNIEFCWDLTVCGVTVTSTDSILIFSGIAMEDTSEVEACLKYFPNLERVEMCDCGISSDEMDALSKRHPEIRFVWTIKIRNGTLRTDAIAFIPFKLGYDFDRPLYDSDCKELKYCIDLICLDMGHMQVRDFSFLEYMPKMKYLIVGDTPCKDFSAIGTLKELIYLEIFNVKFTQHEILLNLTNLQDLNLGFTPTTDIEALKQMTWLKRLWLPGTKLSNSQVEELCSALPDTQIVAKASHSTDKGWRDHQNYRDMRDLLGMFYME